MVVGVKRYFLRITMFWSPFCRERWGRFNIEGRSDRFSRDDQVPPPGACKLGYQVPVFIQRYVSIVWYVKHMVMTMMLMMIVMTMMVMRMINDDDIADDGDDDSDDDNDDDYASADTAAAAHDSHIGS